MPGIIKRPRFDSRARLRAPQRCAGELALRRHLSFCARHGLRWDEKAGEHDLPLDPIYAPGRHHQARACRLIAAIYDLRASTELASGFSRASEVQRLVAGLEPSLQHALAQLDIRDRYLAGPEHRRDPFIKGIGDGALVAICVGLSKVNQVTFTRHKLPDTPSEVEEQHDT